MLEGLLWNYCIVESLEDIPEKGVDAWVVIAALSRANLRYFERLMEGLPLTGFCALTEREDLKSIGKLKISADWRLLEKPFTDDEFIVALVDAVRQRY